MKEIILKSFDNHAQALTLLKQNQKKIEEIALACIESLKNNGKIIFMGNGGSAADSQHLAAELVGRFKKNRKALASLSLTTDTSIITSIGNDLGYEFVFSRQIEAIAKPQDIVIGLSTSGNSANVIKAIEKAKEMKIKTIGLLGHDGGKLAKIVDIALIISGVDTAGIQEMHGLTGHIVCEIIETTLT